MWLHALADAFKVPIGASGKTRCSALCSGMVACRIRRFFLASGQVQGVGFRPFVYGLAQKCALTGMVGNTSDGVRIEVQGSPENIACFGRLLHEELPPLARLASLRQEDIAPVLDEVGFVIALSSGQAGHSVLISPDVGLCAECCAEMDDPANRRHGYAFTNCVNCGPRYTITRSIPYDRATTSMQCFPLCSACAAEYADPANRRFHAQPVACPRCGPRLWFVRRGEAGLPDRENSPCDPLDQAAEFLCAGGIMALKGLGGFQLTCDAYNIAAVGELRLRKNRPHKPLAVMVANIEAARSVCALMPEHEALLLCPEKPIVLCPRAQAGDAAFALPVEIAPDSRTVGLMLPSTPLHAVLLDRLSRLRGLDKSPRSCEPGLLVEAPNQSPSQPPIALVMTSANPRGEPISLGNREALERLAHLADAWLLHDRDILARVDDSVLALQSREIERTAPATPMPPSASATPAAALFYRRARGYVPRPISLTACGGSGKAFVTTSAEAPVIFGAGADLKNTFCLTRGAEAFVSQHIGDLENPATLAFYEEAAAHLEALLEVRPAAFVCDAHPDFFSTHYARARAESLGLPFMTLQHHAAHAAAVAAENQCCEPMLALCLDGAGFGTDGTMWGGELLYVDMSVPRWERLGGLSTFALPGGDAATREPWRIALALAREQVVAFPSPVLAPIPASVLGQAFALPTAWEALNPSAVSAVTEMLQRSVHCPRTSSCGRLFDAVSAYLGLCFATSYEGQAAVRLESAASSELTAALRDMPQGSAGSPVVSDAQSGRLLLDSAWLFAAVIADVAAGATTAQAAARFHIRLARGLADLAAYASHASHAIYASHPSRAGGRLDLRKTRPSPRLSLNLKAGQNRCLKVGLSGGVMQNAILAALLPQCLRDVGLEPLTHHEVPAGDGGIALGQVAWARQVLRG